MPAKRIYLAGPMTGLPEYNYPAFNAEAARLREMGFHVENPAANPEYRAQPEAAARTDGLHHQPPPSQPSAAISRPLNSAP